MSSSRGENTREMTFCSRNSRKRIFLPRFDAAAARVSYYNMCAGKIRLTASRFALLCRYIRYEITAGKVQNVIDNECRNFSPRHLNPGNILDSHIKASIFLDRTYYYTMKSFSLSMNQFFPLLYFPPPRVLRTLIKYIIIKIRRGLWFRGNHSARIISLIRTIAGSGGFG